MTSYAEEETRTCRHLRKMRCSADLSKILPRHDKETLPEKFSFRRSLFDGHLLVVRREVEDKKHTAAARLGFKTRNTMYERDDRIMMHWKLKTGEIGCAYVYLCAAQA